VNNSQPVDKDTELRPDAEKSFGYGDAVARILALEREVTELRTRFEEISAGTFTPPNKPFGSGSHRPAPVGDLGLSRPAEALLSADSTIDTRPTDSAEWDPRRKAECPECGRVVSADSLARHRRRAHSAARPGEEAEP